MKIKFLMTGLLGLMTITAFAQKSELTTAETEFNKYDQLRNNKAMAKIANTSLTAAKASIDKAAANEKTANLAQTYALKGSIYSALAASDTVAATSTPLFATAEEALTKAKELDTKGEYKKMIDQAHLNMAQYQLNKGVKEYGDKKYDLAYKSFDYYRTVLPEDTNAIYYTGIAAANAGMWDAAITNYNKLVTTKYSGKQRAYQDLSNFYLQKKDTVGAIKVLNDAAAAYPTDPTFSKRVIELNLQTGKQAEVLANIEKAIANDPKNKVLYYYAGITYTQVADQYNKKIDALSKNAPAKTATPATRPGAKPAAQPAVTATISPEMADLVKNRDENLKKAENAYRKALEIDPNYFEANLNLGYVLINPAIDLFNKTRNLPVSRQKEYDAGMAKANVLFDAAKPYLQKAVDLQPKNVDALTNLRTYYLGKNDMAHANELKKQIEALQQGGSAPAQK
ncbi:tetratricopeptide repeat protein [Mucilaginibacter boryungensis]|uniref:Tetratricopeptide repeat protein n=1 Tax=Mucilaginibacter boryungensis TaxID=768480 RepID=A0ABR9XHE9_9SPHI|nr:tetratricopeptide repeat protein [Mucilaginibacter boryungensis]MBE9666489.1 tetratricopeptide repeat protein [Mucilaginibacter boryungensis]